MNREEIESLLGVWFAENPSDLEVFNEAARERLADVVAAALDPSLMTVSVAQDSRRVVSLLMDFLGVAPLRLRKMGVEFDPRNATEGERAACRRVIAAALTMTDRRKDLLRLLSESKVSTSSVARATGMARSTLAPSNSPLLACLMDFMVEYAGRQENRPSRDGSVVALQRRLQERDDEIAMLRRSLLDGAEKEVKYRRMTSEVERLQNEAAEARRSEQKMGAAAARMRDVLVSHGIDVPVELDELERMDALAGMFRSMQSGGGMVS